MLFYKITGKIKDEAWTKKYNDRKLSEGVADRFASEVNDFSEKRDDYFFLIMLNANKIEMGAIVDGFYDISEPVNELLEKMDFNVEKIKINEISLEANNRMLKAAERMRYISDEYEVLSRFGLEDFSKTFGRLPFLETIIKEKSKSTVYKDAKKCMCDDTFIPELDRIYESDNKLDTIAHPVHYAVKSGDGDLCTSICDNLMSALYANNRVKSKRYTKFLLDGTERNVDTADIGKIYKNSVGGTIILKIFMRDKDQNDKAYGEVDFIEKICKLIRKNRHNVLTILVFPNESRRIQSLFFENLYGLSFIEIEEDLSNQERATEYLKTKAKEKHIRCNKKLFNKIEPDQQYYTKELNEIFDDWYHAKIKDTCFSQYKECAVIKRENYKQKVMGSAHDELCEMIGLTEAKKIINKALDYYEAQKLFKDKGMKNTNPAMHMVFTGNPGSAKTSVARLFSRILRENQVLPRGHMVEVGRGDLVGKYVGWTAPNIQKKFTEAKGGVLFIDEAYALVDDSDGSYGDEAINTIVQEMENHREDVVVIFAGYPREMEKFLAKNPGLRSRIAFHVPFDDYDADELCDIAKLMAKKDGLVLSDDALDKMHDIFESVRKENDFGNGRFVRNILEDARMAQASRLVNMDFDDVKKSDIKTLKGCDIEMPASFKKKAEKHSAIGFVS